MKIVAIQRGETKAEHSYLVDLEEHHKGQIIDVKEGIMWPPMSIHSLLLRGYWEPIEHTDQLLDDILAAIPAKQVMKQASIVGGPERSRKSVKESEGVHGMATPINKLTNEERLKLFFPNGVYDWDVAGEYAAENPPTYTKNIDHAALFKIARAEGLKKGGGGA